MYLIHIKDILENKEYIYNTNSSDRDNFENCIKFLKNQLPTENQNKIKYNIFQDYCEVYYDLEFKNKGWVWSSIEIRKDIIYILTKIKILNFEDNKLNNSSQTYNKLKDFESQTETPFEYIKPIDKSILDIASNNDFFKSIKNEDKQHLKTNYNYYNPNINYYDQNCNQNVNYYNQNYNSNDNYYDQTNQRSQHQLSSGYARNPIIPMWPDNFITELEEKFSTLNFGLSPTNPNYF